MGPMRNVEFNGLGLQKTPLDRWGKDPVTDHVTRGHILKFVMADILGFIFSCSLLAEDGWQDSAHKHRFASRGKQFV